MQDRKYIPIIAATAFILGAAVLAYYLFINRDIAVLQPGAEQDLFNALSSPSNEALSGSELEELKNALSAPSNSRDVLSEEEQGDLLRSLMSPGQ